MNFFRKIFSNEKRARKTSHDSVFSPKSCPGKYYVSCDCLDHDLCKSTAPMLFERDDDLGAYYVSKQPENEKEEELMRECIEGCPMDTIMDDGNSIDWKDSKIN